jgi:hypothetical protein
MNSNWATEHLQAIRTLMERSAIYRRALAPISIFVGVTGIVAAVAAWQLKIDSSRAFAIFWMGVSLFALVGAFLLVRRQALKESEVFWSPPTRRVAQAMTPALFIGMVTGLVVIGWIPGPDFLIQTVLVVTWSVMYGCALHSAGFFMPRGIRLFGWLFILGGCGLLGCLLGGVAVDRISPHLMMGVLFGGLHLAYGIYLYFTEPGKNET